MLEYTNFRELYEPELCLPAPQLSTRKPRALQVEESLCRLGSPRLPRPHAPLTIQLHNTWQPLQTMLLRKKPLILHGQCKQFNNPPAFLDNSKALCWADQDPHGLELCGLPKLPLQFLMPVCIWIDGKQIPGTSASISFPTSSVTISSCSFPSTIPQVPLTTVHTCNHILSLLPSNNTWIPL